MRLPALLAVSALLLAGCSGSGPTRTPTEDVVLEPLLGADGGLQRPVALAHAADGSGRLFVVEQKGLVRVVRDGALVGEPFLDLAQGGDDPVVSDRHNEQGLLGLAFHPDYAQNGRFYVHYTAVGGDVTVAEYRNPEPDGDRADAGSGRVLLTVEHSEYNNHNGGALAFGPDGFLYVAIGDGGSGGDPDNNAQDLESLLGKILRLDVDGRGAGQYGIPPGNPFAGKAGRDEVWAYGLRNPWRMGFDGETGDLWVGDVGQNAWEEVNRLPAGQGGVNLGWSRFEGTHTYKGDRQAPGAVPPVLEYGHGKDGGEHCSVVGGFVYRGDAVPSLRGRYVFADYCSGFVWTTDAGAPGPTELVLDSPYNVSAFGEDEDGELYVVDHGGAILRVLSA